MSQVALIVRLGLLVRSAAAGWKRFGISSGGGNAPGGLVAPGLGCSVAGGMPWGGGAKMRGEIRHIGRGLFSSRLREKFRLTLWPDITQ